MNTEEFIEKAKKVHGDKYVYSKVEYISYRKKVCITCPIHGDFFQTPDGHLQGRGCQKCYDVRRGESRRKDEVFFIEQMKEIFGNKYDLSKVKYISNKKKVCLVCPEHGDFWQTPNHLLDRKTGCPICSKKENGKKHSKTKEKFILDAKKIHGDLYDYSMVEYVNAKTPVKIICKTHGIFEQKPNYHLCGNGCPKCKMSKLEIEMMRELDSNNIEYKFHYHPDCLGGLELDFYLPEVKLGIECQGRQHYKPISFFGGEEGFKKTTERDCLKDELCKENNIKLIFFTNENVQKERTYNNCKKIIEEIKKL